MSTVDKGNALEKRVFAAIRRELVEGRLIFQPGACTVHLRKAYPSRDRGSGIIVDVSIEAYLPGQETWSLLWVWECKDYTSSVPVSDIEEFWAKLQQIGGANIKGTVVATGAFQAGALNFARSKGLSVARILREDDLPDHLPVDRMDTQVPSLGIDFTGLSGLFALHLTAGRVTKMLMRSICLGSQDELHLCIAALTKKWSWGKMGPFYGLSGARVYHCWTSMLTDVLDENLVKARPDSNPREH